MTELRLLLEGCEAFAQDREPSSSGIRPIRRSRATALLMLSAHPESHGRMPTHDLN